MEESSRWAHLTNETETHPLLNPNANRCQLKKQPIHASWQSVLKYVCVSVYVCIRGMLPALAEFD